MVLGSGFEVSRLVGLGFSFWAFFWGVIQRLELESFEDEGFGAVPGKLQVVLSDLTL